MCWYKQFSWWSCGQNVAYYNLKVYHYHIFKEKKNNSECNLPILREWRDATKLEHSIVNKHCLQGRRVLQELF